MQVVPSILTNDPQELKSLINLYEDQVDMVSIDIIDGKFAANRTIIPDALRYIETNLKLDFQLMVKEPANWVESCAHAGAYRVIGHVEQMRNQDEFVDKVAATGALIGLGLDLTTPISAINSRLINNLDVILLMSVKAGFGGQKFCHQVLNKIKQLSEIRSQDQSPFKIHVDGGVTIEIVKQLADLGVDEISVGRGLLKGDAAINIKNYQLAAHGR